MLFGLEDWHGLLERFCVADKSFEYYLSLTKAKGDLSEVAHFLAEDFNKHWWNAAEYRESVK
jgi:hypothetical protein